MIYIDRWRNNKLKSLFIMANNNLQPFKKKKTQQASMVLIHLNTLNNKLQGWT